MNLVIVQDKPTQFDVPLYNQIAIEKPFNLSVIYSQTTLNDQNIDPELGLSPIWDHIKETHYNRIDLDEKQRLSVDKSVNIITDLTPDLVIISGYYPALHRRLVSPLKKRGISVGLRSDNTLPHSNFSGIKGILKKNILPGWLKQYDSWHPVGSMSQQYLEVISKSQIPTYLFPYNVDNNWFFKESAKYSAEKSKLIGEMGFGDDSFLVLGIMKWNDREDPLTLIDAFIKLIRKNANAKLILVGDGPLRKEVESRLKTIKDKVFTPGYAGYSQLPKYYGVADVFVHPSPNEPWGVSVNEAMACGVPVIAAAGVGAGKDLIIENKTGHVFNNRNSEELAKVLLLISLNASRKKMAAACVAKMKNWNYSQSISEFVNAIRKTNR